jgi:hypothetical protein
LKKKEELPEKYKKTIEEAYERYFGIIKRRVAERMNWRINEDQG